MLRYFKNNLGLGKPLRILGSSDFSSLNPKDLVSVENLETLEFLNEMEWDRWSILLHAEVPFL